MAEYSPGFIDWLRGQGLRQPTDPWEWESVGIQTGSDKPTMESWLRGDGTAPIDVQPELAAVQHFGMERVLTEAIRRRDELGALGGKRQLTHTEKRALLQAQAFLEEARNPPRLRGVALEAARAAKQDLTMLRAAEGQPPTSLEEPPSEGNFLQAIGQAWPATQIALEQLGNMLGFEVTEDKTRDAWVMAAAYGLAPMPEDPIEQYWALRARGYMRANHPRYFRMMESGSRYKQDHFLRGLASDVVAFLPLALVEGAALPSMIARQGLGTTARLSARSIAVNTAIGAAEAFAFTPGGTEQRAWSAALALPIIGAFGTGAAAVQRRLHSPALQKTLLKRAGRAMRLNDSLFVGADTPVGRRVLRAIGGGHVDEPTLTDLARKGATLDDLGEYVNDVLKRVAETAKAGAGNTAVVERTFAPRAAVTASWQGRLLARRLKTQGGDQAEFIRISKELERLGETDFDLLAAASQGPANPNFEPAVMRYAEKLGAETTARIEGELDAAGKKHPQLTPEDLDELGHALFAGEFAGRVRGVDVEFSADFWDELVTEAGVLLQRSRPVAERGAPQAIAGKVKIGLGRPEIRERVVRPEGTRRLPLQGRAAIDYESVRPYFNVAVQLFADPRPGRVAYEGIHELAHAHLYLLQATDPAKYERLVAEVVEIYSNGLGKALDVDEVTDPIRLSEMFTELITNRAMFGPGRTGRPIVQEMADRFGADVARLLERVDGWRKKYYRVRRLWGQPMPEGLRYGKPALVPWSNELRGVADLYSRRDWGGLYDRLLAGDGVVQSRGRGPVSDLFFDVLRYTDEELESLSGGQYGRLVRASTHPWIDASPGDILGMPGDPVAFLGSMSRPRATIFWDEVGGENVYVAKDRRGRVIPNGTKGYFPTYPEAQRAAEARALGAARTPEQLAAGEEAGRQARWLRRTIRESVETGAPLAARLELTPQLERARAGITQAEATLENVAAERRTLQTLQDRLQAEAAAGKGGRAQARLEASQRSTSAKLARLERQEQAARTQIEKLTPRAAKLEAELEGAKKITRRALALVRATTGRPDWWVTRRFKGLPRPLRVRADVRPELYRAIARHDWARLGQALLSNRPLQIVQRDGSTVEVPVREWVRRLATWYEDSQAAFPRIRAELVRLASKYDPTNLAFWRDITDEIIGGHIGVQGATRGPDLNLRNAIIAMVYESRVPGGHHPKLTLDQAMRSATVSAFGPLPDAPAADVLRSFAAWGHEGARKILANGSVPQGMSWLEYLRTIEPPEFEGALKLASYSRCLLGGTDEVANDIWQFRLFLWNDPDVINGIYRLADDPGEYVRVQSAVRSQRNASKASVRAATARIQELRTRALQATPAERKQIEQEIADLAIKAEEHDNRGAFIWSSGREVAYTPRNGEYYLMEELQHEFARMLNEISGDQFWTGKRAQAALWGLMRGALRERGERGAPGILHFGQALDDLLETPPEAMSKLEALFTETLDRARTDEAASTLIKSGNEIGTPYGLSEAYNVLYNTAMRAATLLTGSGADEVVRAISDIVTMNGSLPVNLSKIFGLSRPRSAPQFGVYQGATARSAEVMIQTAVESNPRVLHMMAAMNGGQRAMEWAEIAEVFPIGSKSPLLNASPDDVAGFVVQFPGAKTPAQAEAAFDAWWTEVGRIAGKPREAVVDGASVSWEPTLNGMARISVFGIPDHEAFAASAVAAAQQHKGVLRAFRGRTGYMDLWEELDAIADSHPSNPWSIAWREARTVDVRGSLEEVRYGAVRARDLVTARHLFHALDGVDVDTQRSLVREYLFAQRARLTLLWNLKQQEDQIVQRGARWIGDEQVNQMISLARGHALRLLDAIEPQLLPAGLVDDEVRRSLSARGLKTLPRELQPYLSETRTVGRKLGISVDTFYDTLAPEDLAEVASRRAVAAGRAAAGERAASYRQTAQSAPRDASPPEVLLAEHATGGGARGLVQESIGLMRHGYRSLFKSRTVDVEHISPDIANRFNLLLSADVHAMTIAQRSLRWVTRHAPNARETELFERWGQDQKARALLSRGDQPGPGMQALMLSDAEQVEVAQNQKIQAMIADYRDHVQPELEALLIQIDPDNADHLLRTPSGVFFPSMRWDPRIHGEGVRRTNSGGATKSLPSRFSVQRQSPAMKRLKGTAEQYVLDLRELIRWRLTRDQTIAETKRTLQALKDQGYLRPAAKGIEEPQPLVAGNREIPWRKIRVLDRPAWLEIAEGADGGMDGAAPSVRKRPVLHEEYWVPAPVADAWEYYIQRGWRELQFGRNARGGKNLWFKLADITTAAMLATFAEASRHSLRVLSMLARIPSPTNEAREIAAKFLAPYVGVRGLKIFQMMNVYHHPSAIQFERWAARVGGIPERAFEEAAEAGEAAGSLAARATERLGAPAGKAVQVGEKVAGLVHRGREFLFELPDPEARGIRAGPFGIPVPARLWGFDVRARVLATKIFFDHLQVTGKIGPDVTIEQLARAGATEWDGPLREYLTQFGMFNGKLQTKVVQWVRKTRLNPFGGAQGGFRPAEVETFLGIGRLPMKDTPAWMKAWYSTQVLAGGWLGYMGALMVANKAFSGHWPWQNQEGREFDLELPWKEKDGTPAYISSSFLEPAGSRAARTTGFRYVWDERMGDTVRERLATSLTEKGLQEIASFMLAGPPVQFLTQAVAGRAPYISGGELLRTAPPAATSTGQLANNLKAAIVSINGYTSAVFAESLATGKHYENPYLKYSMGAAEVLFGRIGAAGRNPLVEAGGLAAAKSRRRGEVVAYHVRRYREAASEEQKREAYAGLIEQYSGAERQRAIREFWEIYASQPKAAARRAVESQILRGGP